MILFTPNDKSYSQHRHYREFFEMHAVLFCCCVLSCDNYSLVMLFFGLEYFYMNRFVSSYSCYSTLYAQNNKSWTNIAITVIFFRCILLLVFKVQGVQLRSRCWEWPAVCRKSWHVSVDLHQFFSEFLKFWMFTESSLYQNKFFGLRHVCLRHMYAWDLCMLTAYVCLRLMYAWGICML